MCAVSAVLWQWGTGAWTSMLAISDAAHVPQATAGEGGKEAPSYGSCPSLTFWVRGYQGGGRKAREIHLASWRVLCSCWCVSISLHLCASVCLHLCVSVCMRIFACEFAFACVSAYLWVHAGALARRFPPAQSHVHTHTHMHIHTHTHAHTHTCTYTQ